MVSPSLGAVGWAVFDTAIGACGIGWSERGVVAVHLPEPSPEQTRSRLARRCPSACEAEPPPHVRRAMDDITRLLAGERPDLSYIVLDLEGISAFESRVYEVARRIPPGETLTYGAIATRLGEPGAAREVGGALGRNPFPIVVPCHRVVAANGLGGFSARGGLATKLRLLGIERAEVAGALDLFADGGA